MISLFARVKNEYNVNEWMLYHYDIGFEHIYLYDDYDCESPSVKTQIMDIIDKNKYTIINKLNNDKNIPHHLFLNSNIFYETIIDIIKTNNTTTYLLHSDIDEYFVLNKFKTIQQMIEYYEPFDHLYINWVIFGNSHIKIIESTETLLDKFTMSGVGFRTFGKSIVKIENVKTSSSPHYMIMKKNSIYKDIWNNQFTDIKDSTYTINKHSNSTILNGYEDKCYIAHFMNQGTENFIKRRFYKLNIEYRFCLFKNSNELYDQYMQILNHNYYEIINMFHNYDIVNINKITENNIMIDIFNNIYDFFINHTYNSIINNSFNSYVKNNKYKLYGKKCDIIYENSLVNLNINNYIILNPDLKTFNIDQTYIHFLKYCKSKKEKRLFEFSNTPIDFDPKKYKLLNVDLQHLSDEDLFVHYEIHGFYEKRKIK
jgi:hypothetical protein